MKTTGIRAVVMVAKSSLYAHAVIPEIVQRAGLASLQSPD
jgi:hypothetical protein